MKARAKVFALLLAIVLLFAWLAFARQGIEQAKSHSAAEDKQQPRPQNLAHFGKTSAEPRAGYSTFSHATKAHQQECSNCHKFPSANWKSVRVGKAAFADVTEYPEHPSCLKCHYQQFFAKEKPAPQICSVCHVAVTPRFTERKPFPNPPEVFDATKQAESFVSDFRISFTHLTHLELVGDNLTPGGNDAGFKLTSASFRQKKDAPVDEKTCAFCHQTYQPQGKSADEFVSPRPKGLADDSFWLKKGTIKTTPNHASCFTCHTPEGDIKPASNECAACHKLVPQAEMLRADFDPTLAAAMGITDATVLIKLRGRYSSGSYRHEGGLHPDQGCVTCHNVSIMKTEDVKTLKVPITACDVCHIGATADDGILNFEIDKRKANPSFQCTKCHISFGKEPIPESHLKAIPQAKTK